MDSFNRTLTVLQKQHSLTLEQAKLFWAMDWLLHGIAAVPELQSQLAFKGGVVLMKCHQGRRFSTDIDANLLQRTGTPQEEAAHRYPRIL